MGRNERGHRPLPYWITNSSDDDSISLCSKKVDKESTEGDEEEEIEHDEISRPGAGDADDDNDAGGKGEDEGDETNGDNVSLLSSGSGGE